MEFEERLNKSIAGELVTFNDYARYCIGLLPSTIESLMIKVKADEYQRAIRGDLSTPQKMILIVCIGGAIGIVAVIMLMRVMG